MSPKIQDGSRLDRRFGSTKGYQKFSGQAGRLGRAGLVAVGIGLTIDGINSYNSYSEAISGMDYNGQLEMVNKSWRTALEAALFGEIPMNRADISSVADFIYRGTPINDSQLQSIADKLAKDMGIYQHRSAIRTESGLDNYHGQYIITD